MTDDRLSELINKEISGKITVQERDELHEYLRNNPAAQKTYRELLRTSELLSEMREVEPPVHLKRRIMHSLDFGRYEAIESRPVLELVSRVRRLGLRPRLAYAFALGVVVGLLVFSQFVTERAGRYPPDVRALYGTIGIPKDASLTVIEQVPIDLAQAAGRINLSQFADLLIFEIALRSTRQFEVLLEYDPAQVTLNGLRPVDHSGLLLELDEGYVRTSGYGARELNLSFVKEPASTAYIELGLSISGELLYSHRFVAGPQNEQQSGGRTE
jgi:hypothetical protein